MLRGKSGEFSSGPEIVNVNELVPELIKSVKNPLDIRSWRRAFPEIKFTEYDEGFTGDLINWAQRSEFEKAVYVAYMINPQHAKVEYQIEVDGYPIRQEIDDSERIWYMWMRGCFVTSSDSSKAMLSDEAMQLLFYYAAQSAGSFEGIIMDRYDTGDVKFVNLEMTVAKI